ncbi:MAG: hypothetical protein Kow0075_01960 [Salibacteraceae bacterium]
MSGTNVIIAESENGMPDGVYVSVSEVARQIVRDAALAATPLTMVFDESSSQSDVVAQLARDLTHLRNAGHDFKPFLYILDLRAVEALSCADAVELSQMIFDRCLQKVMSRKRNAGSV